MRDLEVKQTELGVQLHGPFLPEYRVTSNGYRVPYIHAFELEDGRVEIVVDHRFGLEGPISREEFDRWIPLLANAMAVAAGYSCHGENCTPINPFTTRMSQLGSLPPDLTVVPGGKQPDEPR